MALHYIARGREKKRFNKQKVSFRLFLFFLLLFDGEGVTSDSRERERERVRTTSFSICVLVKNEGFFVPWSSDPIVSCPPRSPSSSSSSSSSFFYTWIIGYLYEYCAFFPVVDLEKKITTTFCPKSAKCDVVSQQKRRSSKRGGGGGGGQDQTSVIV